MKPIARCLLVAGLALSMAACVNAASEPDLKAVKAEIQKKLPQRTVDSVRTTPVKGIYEVVMKPHQIVYTDAHADYMFVGDLVDLKNRVSLTELRQSELMRTDFSTLPLDKAFKVVKGDGSRKVVVFSDPDCPFCKRLENDTLSKIDNVTIYTLLFPLTSIHPDSARKAGLIWCADDKQQAWQDWMTTGKLPVNDGKCETPVAEIASLAEKLNVQATPTIVFESGEIVPGAIDPATFEAKLAKKAAAVAQ
ncbi:MAG: DsbC family protein [Burkholderiales bacterium]|nr:DsbC family protein [Burkholderiales bacterium]